MDGPSRYAVDPVRSRGGTIGGVHEASGGERVPRCGKGRRVVEDATRFNASGGIPGEHLRDRCQILRAVGRVVDPGRSVQAIVRQTAPATRLVSACNRGWVSRDAGDPKFGEQGLDLGLELRHLAGLADDATGNTASQLAQKAISNAALEA